MKCQQGNVHGIRNKTEKYFDRQLEDLRNFPQAHTYADCDPFSLIEDLEKSVLHVHTHQTNFYSKSYESGKHFKHGGLPTISQLLKDRQNRSII